MNQIIHPILLKISLKTYYKTCLILITALLLSCTAKLPNCNVVNSEPKIDPDYSGVTIPPNIAPLNFKINEGADKFLVKMDSHKGVSFIIESDDGKVLIPMKKWHNLLKSSKGSDLFIDVYASKGGQWIKYKTISNHVSEDPIDNHLVYRLISPGFELWHEMGIYQRNLENFDEDPIMISELSDKSCMNCHSFCKNNSNTMLFHTRGKLGGTIIRRNGKTTFVNTKTDQTLSPAVYPAWHPNGRYIAFSVNQIIQEFHATGTKKVEVLDTASDLIVFDAETNTVFKSPKIATENNFETFPCWSPDGNSLYFCSARALPQDKFDQIRYDLLRIAFNPATMQFGEIDTIISANRIGKSVSFPRISPDGKYLMFCMINYGNFSIWHKESDLYLLNLESKEITKPDIASDQSESYHQWSSTGRWIVFSSRRHNGLYTRPYFSFFDREGHAQKPFLLPQKDPDFYEDFLKSYNVPELVTSKVEINPRDLYDVIRSKPENVKFENIK
jgi:hypothetical protein